jgi:predicted small lipoprotein YifL
MACPGVGKDLRSIQALSRSMMLLLILLTLGACSHPGYPLYQPFPEGSYSAYPQGYQDVQLNGDTYNGDTYLVLYRNYKSHYGLLNPPDYKWVQGAQEYALYRAGELAKSKGGKYFVVLHKDDWNLISVGSGYKGRSQAHVEPGAGLVIKVLSNYPLAMQPNEDRIYEIDKLLQNLSEKNSGLAEYLGSPHRDKTVNNTANGFSRWRSPSGVPIPGAQQKTMFGSVYTKVEHGRTVVPLTPSGQFEFAIWDDRFIAPLQFLAECIKLADQERYEVFKLENWTGEEYRGNGKVWFLTKAKIILLHKKEPDSLNAVFVVDELRQNIDVTKVKP